MTPAADHLPIEPGLRGAVRLAIGDLARRRGLRPEQIEAIEARRVTWLDGSLGCPQVGVEYPQRLVDGLLIRLRVGERIFEYHAGSGAPALCEHPSERGPLPPRGV